MSSRSSSPSLEKLLVGQAQVGSSAIQSADADKLESNGKRLFFLWHRFSSAVLAAEDFGSKPLNAIGNNQGKSNQDVEKSDNPLQESVNSLEDQVDFQS